MLTNQLLYVIIAIVDSSTNKYTIKESLMRKFRIVADSSADVLSLDCTDFAYAPMKIITADREFVDDDAIDVEEMTEFFDSYKGRSQTSCPNTADWLDAFEGADDIICVTITSGLSGSYNSACAAKQIYESENEGARVFVLDSLSAGPEMKLAIEKIEEYASQGMDFEDICKSITKYVQGTGLVFMLKSLKNFANNGRVSPVVAKIVGIAGICIVGKASDEGTLEPLHKCRGEIKSLAAIVSHLEENGFSNGKVRIAHCSNPSAAEKLKQMISTKFKTVDAEVYRHRGLCSFYAEKGGILVGFEKH